MSAVAPVPSPHRNRLVTLRILSVRRRRRMRAALAREFSLVCARTSSTRRTTRRPHPRAMSSEETREGDTSARAPETNEPYDDERERSRRFPYVDASTFVDATGLSDAVAALRKATDSASALVAAEWLDRAAGNTKKRIRAAREAARTFMELNLEARKDWADAPADVVRRVTSALASTAASRGEIGWLETVGAGTAVNGAEAFQACLQDVLDRKRLLVDDYAYLLVPGLFGSYYPAYYTDVRDEFVRRGVDARISKLVDGEGSVVVNAAALAQEIEELHKETGKMVVVLGHSKGGVDGGATLSLHDDRLRKIVRGLIAVQSPFGGSPIATDLLSPSLREPVSVLLELLVSAPKGDGARLIEPISDLTYAARREFLTKHPIPASYAVVSFATVTKSVAAGLFPSASYISNRYGEASDGLVCVRDAQIPNAVCVVANFENDHADCVFPSKHASDMVDRHTREQAENLALRQRLGFTDPNRAGPPLPPPIGTSIVAAQRALGDALPERLKNSPSSADYHEALVGVLLRHRS